MLSYVYHTKRCHIQGGHNRNLLLLISRLMSMYCFHKFGFIIFDNSEKLECAVINFYYI
jgi:hypothetical protein